jgi:hypothetical protein
MKSTEKIQAESSCRNCFIKSIPGHHLSGGNGEEHADPSGVDQGPEQRERDDVPHVVLRLARRQDRIRHHHRVHDWSVQLKKQTFFDHFFLKYTQ